MKIIASAGSKTIIVEMTHREFAKIGGFSYETDLSESDNKGVHPYHRVESFRIGRELDVNAIYDRLLSQQNVSDRLNDAAKNLRAIADLTECVAPALALLTEEGVSK